MATPHSGNHHDPSDIQVVFDELCKVLEEAKTDLKGVFLNADNDFDAQLSREQCS